MSDYKKAVDAFEHGIPLYVFGYGSLTFPNGIHGRGMLHMYDEDELHYALLSEWKRGWYARWGKNLYYGILPDHDSTTNGAVFKIHSIDDLHNLNLSEQCDIYGDSGTDGYTLTDVTSKIVTKGIEPNAIVFTYANSTVPTDGTPREDYRSYVDRGFESVWGRSLLHKFKNTTEEHKAN